MQQFINNIINFWKNIDWNEVCEFFYHEYVIYTACGFVAILLIKNFFKKRVIRVRKSNGGEVILSEKALGQIVERICAYANTVMVPSTKIVQYRKKFALNVRLHIGFGSKVSEATADLQARLRKTFTEEIGIENDFSVNISVVGFLSNTDTQRVEKMYLKKYGERLSFDQEI